MGKTLFGALNFRTNRFHWKQTDRGTSQQFIVFLRQLHQNHPNKKLIIILDNGSIHKSGKVKDFIKSHSWVQLFFLPPYFPEYNPIERFWNWLKQKVYGCRSFMNIETLIERIRKLIWHYHENKTVSKINFQYEAYANLR